MYSRFQNQSFAAVATIRVFYRYKRTLYLALYFSRILSKCKVREKSNVMSRNLMFQLLALVSVRYKPLKTFYSALEVHEVHRYNSVEQTLS